MNITQSGKWGDPDPRMIYRVNKHGHHGTEFVKNPDILAIGCSVTAGCGIPYELTWPHLLAKELNQTVNVIAMPNGSIHRIYNNVISHLKEFGLPKKILFLTPDLKRLWIPEKKNNRYINSSFNWDESYKNFVFNKNQKKKPLIYKDYFNINRNIPLELSIFNALTILHSLEVFELMNIEYSFFSWHSVTNVLYRYTENKFYSSQDDEHNQSDYFLKYPDCTSHLPLINDHLTFWDFTLNSNTHPGMHSHIHYAERFLGRPLSEDTIMKSKSTKKP
jgi:hypothetical protein